MISSKPTLLIERMAPSSRALAFWLFCALFLVCIIVPIGWIPNTARFHLDTILPFFAGIVGSLSLTSWSLGTHERDELRAIERFWRPFAKGSYLVLPSSEPAGTRDGGAIERSPFAPYHDIVAATEIHSFLDRHFGVAPDIISCREIDDIESFGTRNLILIGGPNFNSATNAFMHKIRKVLGSNSFEWSSEFRGEQCIEQLLLRKEDHLVRIDEESHILIEEIFDVRAEGALAPKVARGLCFRGEDVLREGRCVLILAGVDSAFGTLASARLVQNPEYLKRIVPQAVFQMVVHARVDGYDIGRVFCDREINLPALSSDE